jgi:2-polyprenyl-3-methyl-5-hydroxy-6-metoxy-1,4-benzoquinol methylase
MAVVDDAGERAAPERFPPCRICLARFGFRDHHVPRSRYGPEALDPVRYLECHGCGSLIIATVPEDLHREYGSGYHTANGAAARTTWPRPLLRRLRARHAVAGTGGVGRLLSALFPDPLEGFPELLRLAHAEPDSRLLDVGAGTGEILGRLRDAGYQDLTGVDPFLPEVGSREAGVRMIRSELDALTGEGKSEDPFDVVMFNHSLEHVPDPEGALRAARALLSPGGRILVRTPVVGCLAWDRYGTAWVQIDAPRHLFVFSREGLPIMARRAGLELEAVRDDSTEVQFLGSELYQAGHPLHEFSRRFGWARRRRLRREARALNALGRGDQAGFVFSPSQEGASP